MNLKHGGLGLAYAVKLDCPKNWSHSERQYIQWYGETIQVYRYAKIDATCSVHEVLLAQRKLDITDPNQLLQEETFNSGHWGMTGSVITCTTCLPSELLSSVVAPLVNALTLAGARGRHRQLTSLWIQIWGVTTPQIIHTVLIMTRMQRALSARKQDMQR